MLKIIIFKIKLKILFKKKNIIFNFSKTLIYNLQNQQKKGINKYEHTKK